MRDDAVLRRALPLGRGLGHTKGSTLIKEISILLPLSLHARRHLIRTLTPEALLNQQLVQANRASCLPEALVYQAWNTYHRGSYISLLCNWLWTKYYSQLDNCIANNNNNNNNNVTCKAQIHTGSKCAMSCVKQKCFQSLPEGTQGYVWEIPVNVMHSTV